jgi:hypothetical protein
VHRLSNTGLDYRVVGKRLPTAILVYHVLENTYDGFGLTHLAYLTSIDIKDYLSLFAL